MKKLLLLLLILLLALSSISALNEDLTDAITINFTAGLVANVGFSSRYVSSMVYPSSDILSETVSFTLDTSTGYFSTGPFYVFAQVFSPNITVDVSGAPLTYNNDSLSWTNTTTDLTLSSNGSSVNIVTLSGEAEPVSVCKELNFQIDKLTDSTDWNGEYTGTLTLNIKSTS